MTDEEKIQEMIQTAKNCADNYTQDTVFVVKYSSGNENHYRYAIAENYSATCFLNTGETVVARLVRIGGRWIRED